MTDPTNPTSSSSRPMAEPAALPAPATPPWAVPAGAIPSAAMPPGAVPTEPSGWAYLPSMGWVQFATAPAPQPPVAPPAPPASEAWTGPQVPPQAQAWMAPQPLDGPPTQTGPQPWAQPAAWNQAMSGPGTPSAPPPSPWSVAAPVALSPQPAVGPALPLETVVRSGSSSRGRGRPSAYGLTLGIALLLCVGGIGFAAGRASAPAATSAASLGALGARDGFTPGQGFGVPTTDTTGATEPTTTGTGNGASDTTPAAPTATPLPDLSGQGPGGGFPGGGGPGGLGGGGFGLTGTVTAVGDGTLTIETEVGGAQQITTDDATTYHVQQPATAQDVSVGTSVRVTTSGGFPGRGGSQTDPSAALTASDVLVLEP